ncbi:entericidin B precursor [Citrobacter werkmanii]|nr:entericidin B precursor [Citrobacter werkmanii]
MRIVEKVICLRIKQKSEWFEGVTNSKVVFYIHLQLIKDNIFSVVSCYKLGGAMS